MSTSLSGIQIVVADSASRAPSTGIPKAVQDSLALSEALVGVVKNQIDFQADITNEIVQTATAQPSFAVYG
jgi:hypothetical protein